MSAQPKMVYTIEDMEKEEKRVWFEIIEQEGC